MKLMISILAVFTIASSFASTKVELTFKAVGTKAHPQSKIFLVVGSKTVPITTVLGTAFGNNLISNRSWIPAKAVTAMGAFIGKHETQMYVLMHGKDYGVFVRELDGKTKNVPFRLFKIVKG